MYTLIDLGNDTYELTSKSYGSRKGSLRDVVQFAVFDLDFEYKQIEHALVEMNRLGHNAAEFGIFCGFIFTFHTDFKKVG